MQEIAEEYTLSKLSSQATSLKANRLYISASKLPNIKSPKFFARKSSLGLNPNLIQVVDSAQCKDTCLDAAKEGSCGSEFNNNEVLGYCSTKASSTIDSAKVISPGKKENQPHTRIKLDFYPAGGHFGLRGDVDRSPSPIQLNERDQGSSQNKLCLPKSDSQKEVRNSSLAQSSQIKDAGFLSSKGIFIKKKSSCFNPNNRQQKSAMNIEYGSTSQAESKLTQDGISQLNTTPGNNKVPIKLHIKPIAGSRKLSIAKAKPPILDTSLASEPEINLDYNLKKPESNGLLDFRSGMPSFEQLESAMRALGLDEKN